MNIRRAKIRDLSALMAVEVATFTEERYSEDLLLFILTDSSYSTFLAEDGEIVGSASIQIEDGEAQLVSIGVVSHCRCRGIAKALMKAVEKEAISNGAIYMILQVSIANTPAINLYLHHGYEIMQTLKNYYGQGKDAYLMEKIL
ncbi:MAG: GNAT family N-acetyltransferase [Euryarchaeota archaeon]|nr:GNAT family N-acetyltransferase [Euryarchaeota archaeon]